MFSWSSIWIRIIITSHHLLVIMLSITILLLPSQLAWWIPSQSWIQSRFTSIQSILSLYLILWVDLSMLEHSWSCYCTVLHLLLTIWLVLNSVLLSLARVGVLTRTGWSLGRCARWSDLPTLIRCTWCLLAIWVRWMYDSLSLEYSWLVGLITSTLSMLHKTLIIHNPI
jgi:hypothetical protein